MRRRERGHGEEGLRLLLASQIRLMCNGWMLYKKNSSALIISYAYLRHVDFVGFLVLN